MRIAPQRKAEITRNSPLVFGLSLATQHHLVHQRFGFGVLDLLENRIEESGPQHCALQNDMSRVRSRSRNPSTFSSDGSSWTR